MAIGDAFIEELLDRSDIVSIVSSYTRLQKRGATFWGCCPFHSEKTPSFQVNPDKKLFYCFGCKEGGGLISFVEKTEHLEFHDAVAFLARRAGMEIPEEAADRDRYKRRNRLLELNREAARYFHANLSLPEAEIARNYMSSRMIAPQMVIRFGLGFSLNSWDGLTRAMISKGFTKAELLDAGLLVKNDRGGLYDRFRNRLMFPIIDYKGNIIGFGGRVLDDSKPKYLNSPESPLYHKANHLFAMNLAKNTREPRLIIAEGYMDVLMLHQAGFDNAVASLGTALTVEQCEMIRKRVNEVVLVYDSDEAGQKATERAIELLRARDVNIRILKLSGAKDPDEYIKKFGADAFRELVEKSGGTGNYQLEKLAQKHTLATDEDKLSYVQEAIPMAAALKTAAETDIFITRLSEKTGIRRESIQRDLDIYKRRKRRSEQKREIRESLNTNGMPEIASLHLHLNEPALSAIVGQVLGLLAENPELYPEASKEITAENIPDEVIRKLYLAVTGEITAGKTVNPDLLADVLSQDERRLLSALMGENSRGSPKALLADYLKSYREELVKVQAGAGNPEDINALLLWKRSQLSPGNTNS